MNLTGNKNLDMKILSYYTYPELIVLEKHSKAIQGLLQDPRFWVIKLKQDFDIDVLEYRKYEIVTPNEYRQLYRIGTIGLFRTFISSGSKDISIIEYLWNISSHKIRNKIIDVFYSCTQWGPLRKCLYEFYLRIMFCESKTSPKVIKEHTYTGDGPVPDDERTIKWIEEQMRL